MSFEVTFAKAMRLLHSPSKDSADQLKAMLDECLAQRKPAPSTIPKQQPLPSLKPIVNKPVPTVPVPIVPIVGASEDSGDGAAPSCVVCKKIDKLANQLVECQECHSLYHQECHKPSLTNENVKDPRFIWYCTTCTNKRKKIKLPPKPNVATGGNGGPSKELKEQQNPEMSPFKSWTFIKEH